MGSLSNVTNNVLEKLLHAAWGRANELRRNGDDAWLVGEVRDFLDAEDPTVKEYLALEDATLVYQMQVWTRHADGVLRDLARRFLVRDGFAAVEDPVSEAAFGDAHADWEAELRRIVGEHQFAPPEYYALRDDLKLSVYDPYTPEKEEKEQDPYNAVFIQPASGGPPREISTVLKRLAPVTGLREKRCRYYVPKECRDAVRDVAASRAW
jgi:hypothetical protein